MAAELLQLDEYGEPLLPSLFPPPPAWAVALRMEDGLICGYYDLNLWQPEAQEGIELIPLTDEQHQEAFLSYATHFELEPELKAIRLEVSQTADTQGVDTQGVSTRTVEEKLAAIGLSLEELQTAMLG